MSCNNSVRLAFAVALVFSACVFELAVAGTITTNLFYDDTGGPNNGGNLTVSTFDYVTNTLTDPDSGIEFDATIRIAAPAGFDLRTNGSTSNREWGVIDDAQTNNGALDTVGESVTATLQSINVSNLNGFAAGNADVSFDGFTDVILYFVGNVGDAGAITDGSSDLFTWEGTLDATENGGDPNSSNDSLIENPTIGQNTGGSLNGSNARIDLSATLPTMLVVEFRTHSNPPSTGTNDDRNRWRVDDFGVQFTVTTIPEPSGSVLIGVMLAMLSLVGSLRYRRG